MQTLSFISLLSDDKRKFTQAERASVVAAAALNLHLRFKKGEFNTPLNPYNYLSTHVYQYFFCSNIRPNIFNSTDEFNINRESSYIIILFRGQIYKLTVIKNNECISVNEIKNSINKIIELQNGIEHHLPIGAISSASLEKRFAIKRDKFFLNEKTFECLENAVFILCIDDAPYSDRIAEDMFAHRFQNRYFGNIQIIVGTNSECGIINNYVNIEGMPAIEIVDAIYKESLEINFSNQNQNKLRISPEKFELKLNTSDLSILEEDTKKIIHDNKSSYFIEIGHAFFKHIDLSPNVTFNFLLMLSVYEISGIFPVTNHAVSRRENNDVVAQLDWVYISPEKLKKFLEAMNSYPCLDYTVEMCVDINKQKIKKYIQKKIILLFSCGKNWHYLIMPSKVNAPSIKGTLSEENIVALLNTEISALEIKDNNYNLTPTQQANLIYNILTLENCFPVLNELYSVFKDAIEYHKDKIYLSKKGLSPTSFFYKPEGRLFEELSNFYIYCGQFFPAFKNYLFRTYRNNQSIDIITSSLKLPDSIKTIGRPGTCSEVLTMFGLHILMQHKRTELVFIPNKAWIHRLEEIIEKINNWIIKLHLIASASNTAELKMAPFFKR